MEGLEGWGLEGWEAPKFALFVPSPAPIFALFVSLWVSCRGIFVVFFEGRDPQMCTFGVLGLSCETLASFGAAGGPSK